MSPPAASPRLVNVLLVALLAVAGALMVRHGMADPHGGRFWDERYGFANVEAVLLTDDGPANAFYPSLSYLPQAVALWVVDGVHQLTGNPDLAIRRDPASGAQDLWTATAYRTVRLVSALFGVLAVWAAFRLGRRLFGPWAGLAGAALFAAQPALIQASAIFKPDVVVVLGVLVVFGWSLTAVQNPTGRLYALVGVGIGCTVAAKYTGVGAALPLTLGTLRRFPKPAKPWLWLVAAGFVSVVTFVVLNPHIATILAYIPRLFEIAESKSEAEGGSHLLVLAHQGRFLVRHHGWVVLAFAVAGLVGLARGAFRPAGEPSGDGLDDRPGPSRLEAFMVLGFVLGYSLLYAAVIEAFRGQNYLPVSALTALAAGWAVVGAGRFLARRVPILGRRWVAVPVALFLAALVFAHPVRWVYEQVVPTTWTVAGQSLASGLQPVWTRHLIFEKAAVGERVETFRDGHRMATWGVDSIWDVTAQELAVADAVVFRADRLDGPDADRYAGWLAGAGLRVDRLRPEPGSRRGPGLVLARRPWREAAPAVELTVTDGRVTLPGTRPAPGEHWSLSAWLPRRPGEPRARTVRLGERELSLSATRVSGRRAHYLTPRFEPLTTDPEAVGGTAPFTVLGPDGTPWVPSAARPGDDKPPVEAVWTLHRWLPGEAP